VNIRELHVEGFGRWNALSLRGFAPGLNVIYGPNESGKTTLLEFIRTVLYGFAPERRQRYVPSRAGGSAGGSIVFSHNGCLRTLARRDTPDRAGHWLLIDPDGTVHEQPSRDAYLGIDEAIFCRVFAVGLRELQELATLEGEEVASRLYELGAGDRRGLTSAVRELRAARQRLLGSEWRTSPIGVLTDRAVQLRGELQELAGLNASHARATAGWKESQAAIPPLEASLADLQNRLRVADAAAAVGDRLRQRLECLRELESLGEAPDLPDDLARRLEVCKDHIRARRRKIRELKQRREQLRTDLEKIEVNERWLRQAPHVAAAAEQAEWAAAEAKRAGELQREVDALRAQLETQSGGETRKPTAERPALRRHVSPGDLKELKELEEALAAAAAEREQAESVAAELEQAAAAANEQIEEALAARGEQDLQAALDAATEQVRLLRQRVQLDQRIAQLEGNLAELEEAPPAPAEGPLLSVRSLVGLGALFVLGMPLIFAWAVMTGPLSWFLGLLGVAGVGGGVALKLWRDKHGPRDAATTALQIESLHQQIDEATQHREQLDEDLGIPSGDAAEALRAAEKELMQWEKLAPLDHEAQAGQADAADARVQAEQAAAAHQEAEEAWSAALRQLGLAEGITYEQVCEFCQTAEAPALPAAATNRFAELRQQLLARERELQEARRGQQEFAHRIERVFHELGLPVPSGQVAARLRDVRTEMAKQEEHYRRRQELLGQVRRLRRRVVRLCLQGKRWARRRRGLLRQAGVTSEVELYRRLQLVARHAELRKRLAELDREVAARLCGTATIEEVTAALQQTPVDRLGDNRHALRAQFHAAQQQLADLRQRRDEFEAELKRLSKDGSPAEKRMELGAVEEQLRAATEQWHVLAAGSFFLDKVRHVYERDRQPEVLREASRYLAAMTGHKYPRVWAPLDEDVLRIDTTGGQTLGVDVLSSGTREQLFLCLRLALARSYARRGVEVPLVLDDVLVNFDTRRSLAAARLLRDYAADGQQVLLFTCHEHVADMFRALDVAVQALPEIDAETRPAMPVTPSRKPLAPAALAVSSPPEPAKDAWAA
jgi:uncharacterized protein YhaN